jgi:hypothetical protein
MEVLKIRSKIYALLLSVLVLMQSCVVYHKTPTTLEEASIERIKAKITNANGVTHKYQYIENKDGVYYGVNKKSGTLVRLPLEEEEVTVWLKNQTATTWTSLAVIGGSVLVFIVGSRLYIDNNGLY